MRATAYIAGRSKYQNVLSEFGGRSARDATSTRLDTIVRLVSIVCEASFGYTFDTVTTRLEKVCKNDLQGTHHCHMSGPLPV